LGKFWSVLQCNIILNFMAIWSILLPYGLCIAILYTLWQFGIFCGNFGMLYQEKSGNPGFQ
jgi:hypothetical protein